MYGTASKNWTQTTAREVYHRKGNCVDCCTAQTKLTKQTFVVGGVVEQISRILHKFSPKLKHNNYVFSRSGTFFTAYKITAFVVKNPKNKHVLPKKCSFVEKIQKYTFTNIFLKETLLRCLLPELHLGEPAVIRSLSETDGERGLQDPSPTCASPSAKCEKVCSNLRATVIETKCFFYTILNYLKKNT